MSKYTHPLFDTSTQARIETWLTGNYDEKTKKALKELVQNHPQEVLDAFYTDLAFGTGGLRGIMGIGSNRMNSYTVRRASQGLANYIKKQVPSSEQPSVIIGYDSRHQSYEFALDSARVLAQNGIKAFIFKQLRPTPLVSFGCRYKKCTAAIMVTASHNPPEYNGYKVYWDDGAQVLPPHDKGIIAEVNAIQDPSTITLAPENHKLIEYIDTEVDQAYFSAIKDLQHCPEYNQKRGTDLKIVYSPLHGTGMTLMPAALKEWGFPNMEPVASQSKPDGDFPTVTYPNPEDPSALKIGIEQLLQSKADLFIATDPDADRIGVVINHHGKAELLNGNQVACLCAEHICKTLSEAGKLPENGALIKTVVTTELIQAIAHHYQKKCFDVLTGFKYIGELIRSWENNDQEYTYLFGGEESYGYLLGTHARDKDAIISACLICEVALQGKKNGKTLVDLLHDLYRKYGIYREHLKTVCFPETKEGKEKMVKTMDALRNNPPKMILGKMVIVHEDYKTSTRKITLGEGQTEAIEQPKTDLLIFWLEDQTKIAVRPSGTEPKVKIYLGVKKDIAGNELTSQIAETDRYALDIIASLEKLMMQ